MSSSCNFWITETLTRLCCLWYLRQKGTDVQAAHMQKQGQVEMGKGVLISLVMLQRVSPPCVIFFPFLQFESLWFILRLPLCPLPLAIPNIYERPAAEGWAAVNERVFSIHCSHCGSCSWFHLRNKTHNRKSYGSVTEEKARGDLYEEINRLNRCR